ncbi:YhcB family protein [Bermanella sp. WJH001]|uniref:YhcB family protein n=1 Tax=Bermanella sp. WJH001 TaxID=3048005 RepID=UPI0024BE205E|nr:DUF1043 family protein [Bermanella sp. WJH001]MDJ1538199.1 DUF1043 family protein [Bermanella sp. WJH001]
MSAQLISSIFIFAVGIGIGILVQRYVLSRGTHVAILERELDKLKGEQLSMKDALQQHYSQTSDLAQNLTKSYQDLYEHIAKGASQFTEKPLADLKDALEQADSTLKVEAPKDYAEKVALSDQ